MRKTKPWLLPEAVRVHLFKQLDTPVLSFIRSEHRRFLWESPALNLFQDLQTSRFLSCLLCPTCIGSCLDPSLDALNRVGVFFGNYVSETMFRKLCFGNYVSETMFRKLCFENYVSETMFRKPCFGNHGFFGNLKEFFGNLKQFFGN